MHARIFIAAWLWAVGCTSPLFAAQTVEKIKLAIPAKSMGYPAHVRRIASRFHAR